MRRAAWLLIVTVAVAAGSPAAADGDSRPRLISPARRAAAIAAAVVPGFVVHGLGSWVAGDRRTARRLLTAEAGGLGLLLAGGLPLFLTYASRRIASPAIPVTLTGAAVLTTGWLADIWSAAGAARFAGAPRAPAPWRVEAGVTAVADPLFDEAIYARLAGAWSQGRLGILPSALIASDGDAQRLALAGRWRLAGSPATGAAIDDGSRLEVHTGAIVHRHGSDDFTLYTGELAARGRLDGDQVSPALDGGFAELELGVGLELTRYVDLDTDASPILIGRFGVGAYLGDGRGELGVWYDHRRDGLAGGLVASRAAGFLGSVGTTAAIAVAGPWAVTAEIELGSAWLGTVALRFQGGQP